MEEEEKSFCRSAFLAVTAENSLKGRDRDWARRRARVVLPEPGGPQKMREGIFWFFKRLLIKPWGPRRWGWPTKSAIFLGLRSSAKGGDIKRF